jgi:CRISPR-associated endonuclease/helicase Cas3
VHPLTPAPSLYSRYVAIKVSETEKADVAPTREMFLKAIQQQLNNLNIGGNVWISDSRDNKARELSRRVLRIKNKTVVCYSVQVNNLSSEDSVLLQEAGVGGRRRMGCGLFLPTRSSPGS